MKKCTNLGHHFWKTTSIFPINRQQIIVEPHIGVIAKLNKIRDRLQKELVSSMIIYSKYEDVFMCFCDIPTNSISVNILSILPFFLIIPDQNNC